MIQNDQITVKEAAELLGVSRQRVDQLRQQGRISWAYHNGIKVSLADTLNHKPKPHRGPNKRPTGGTA